MGWLIASEATLFAGMGVCYAVIRSQFDAQSWQAQSQFTNTTAGTMNTALLVLGSVLAAAARRAQRRGDPGRTRRWLAIAATCGVCFVAVKMWEYTDEFSAGLTPSNSRILGPILLIDRHPRPACRGRQRGRSPIAPLRTTPAAVGCAVVYWHFCRYCMASFISHTVPLVTEPRVPNAVLATLLVVYTEAMLLIGLASAYTVLRGQYPGPWPPPGQPLPSPAIGALAMAILSASAVSLHLGLRAEVLGAHRRSTELRALAGVIAGLFIAVQIGEAFRLLARGLDLSAPLYGPLLALVVVAHAVHVIAAVIAVIATRINPTLAQLRALNIYWTFVTVAWPPLFALLYLWNPQ